MSRPPRVDFEGARHHVMNRGARKQPIFVDDRDCARFLEIVARTVERYEVRVHAYALMPNHYHLLLETPHANLSRAMQSLGASFTGYLNWRFDWDGPIFRGRFRSRLVERREHWEYLLLYLHLNAVRAGLATSADEANWTSHRDYTLPGFAPDWLTTTELLGAYGGVRRYREQLERVRRGTAAPPEGLDPAALWVGPTVAQPPPATPSPVPLEVALAEVEAVTLVPSSTLATALPRPEAQARWVAAWWLPRRTGRSRREVATALRVCPTVVSKWNRWVEERREIDRRLADWTWDLERRRGESSADT
jgi:REP element-mobilizing transposase RayT